MSPHATIFDDLEHDAFEFRALATAVPAEDWEQPTPAPGWTVRHQVAHIAFVFDLAATAVTDPDQFSAATAAVAEIGFDKVVSARTAEIADRGVFAVLDAWDEAVERSMRALRSTANDATAPWLAGPIPVPVLAAAGMMEVFAHGQDIADALQLAPVRTDRVAHLVRFVHRTRDFGYLARSLEPPVADIRLDVALPSGRGLSVGPAGAKDSVRGKAVELCLIAARRRHRDDTGVIAHGAQADSWLGVAQAYRGPAGRGRSPGQFRHAAA